MTRLSVTDVFAGCGGFSLGFDNEKSYEVLYAIDFWDKALETIKLNKPSIRTIQSDLSVSENLDDLIECVAGTDILIGGPPCQGFSTLGKRRDGDRRSSLVDVFAELTRRVQPKIAIVENVRGIQTKSHPEYGTFANALKRRLESGANGGYVTTSHVLNALTFGVPQNRARWFMLAVRSDLLDEPTTIDRFWEYLGEEAVTNHGTVRDAIGDLPQLDSGEEKKIGNSGLPLFNHKAMKHSQALIDRLKAVPPLGGLPDVPRHLLTPHLRKMLDGQYGSGGHVKNIYGRMDWDSPSGTIVAGIDKITCGRFVHPDQNRLLSPRECARIQSFPDDYEFAGGQVAQYYQIGNAVPPRLSGAIARGLLRFIQREGILALQQGKQAA